MEFCHYYQYWLAANSLHTLNSPEALCICSNALVSSVQEELADELQFSRAGHSLVQVYDIDRVQSLQQVGGACNNRRGWKIGGTWSGA